MNKKFSTLLSGFLLTSAFASAAIDPASLQKATFEKNAATAGQYVIVRDLNNNGEIDATDLALKATLSTNGETLTHVTAALSSVDLKDALWNFEVKEETPTGGKKSYFYALKNVTTGKYLTFSKGCKIVTEAAKAGKAEVGADNSSYFVSAGENMAESAYAGEGVLYLMGATAANALALAETNNEVRLDGKGTAVILCEYKAEQKADLGKMNNVMGGEGFNLESAADKFEGNIFKDGDEYLNLKAFEVRANSIENVPAGTYFVVADESMPATLKGKNATLNTKAKFEAATFVAVDPEANLNINEVPRANGRGFFFKKVKGSDFHFQDTEGQESKGNEIYVGNACFNVINPTLLNYDTYQIYTTTARGLKEAGKDDQIKLNKQWIGTVKDQDVDYVITNTEKAITFTLTNGTMIDPTTLLNDTDAPAIYTIQFVSGKDRGDVSEYGQYLTPLKTDNQNSLRWGSVEEIDANDPLYQWVISAVDEENKTVTFKNRQSTLPMTVSLCENEEGVYTVYPLSTQARWQVFPEAINTNSEDEEVLFDNKGVLLSETKIVLMPVAVEDKFAGFVNRAEGAGLVTFALANNDVAAPEYYVGAAKSSRRRTLTAYSDALDATQFELVKNEKFDKVLNEYIYLKNDRVVTSTEKDTVAFYTYTIKAFDVEEGDGEYICWDNDNFALGTTGLNFVIKKNLDGSVALIDYAETGKPLNYTVSVDANATHFAAVNKKVGNGKAAWKPANTYRLETILSGGLKTFMLEESPLVSYEPVAQHVSFEAVRGGFLTMDGNNDARLAIANGASEDLTFWIEPVDAEANIPYFYIAKGGNYLYNSADSSDYYTPRKNYRFNLENKADGDAKLVYKAGELVDTDTLKTIVNGKSVLVAEKDNAPKKVLGGLKNFQFQIIRAEEGSDEYVIRQEGLYFAQYNNYFYMNAEKDEAYRFIIEKQSAPTSNEGIATTEVKVIAGEGNVTIAGAAGKKVVVSNILGQVVANTVIASDNATIAAPAGVVVVAVEGEAAVKAIVK